MLILWKKLLINFQSFSHYDNIFIQPARDNVSLIQKKNKLKITVNFKTSIENEQVEALSYFQIFTFNFHDYIYLVLIIFH